jgi:hypothetical protein
MLKCLTCKEQFGSQVFCATLWKLWFERNQIVFKQKPFNPMEVERCAADFVAKEQEICSKTLSFNYGTIILNCGKSIKLAKKWRNQQSE